MKKHPYHIVDLSPWPALTSLILLFVSLSAVMYMHSVAGGITLGIVSFSLLILCMAFWWKDVITEGFENHHTSAVQQGIKIGFSLFILSEAVFFIAFFWSSIKPKIFPVGVLEDVWVVREGVWPYEGLKLIDRWNIPFINTMILMLSSTSITWAESSLKRRNREDFLLGLKITIMLGIIFTFAQAFEYMHAPFKFKDGIYPSNFYMVTGFHGLHVIIGIAFLSICYVRGRRGHFFSDKHGSLCFEFASWYWHFVDIVWLLLFALLY